MLIRLLQAFKSITVDLDAHPDARPPAAWANGSNRQAKEKVWLKSHITMFANVRSFLKRRSIQLMLMEFRMDSG
jgi:hypothetical protein